MNITSDFSPLFDAMFTAVQGKIVDEYNAGRITDINYAGVLASALKDTINSSVQATLAADMQVSQKALVDSQKLAVDADTAIKNANNVKQLRILEAQATIAEVDALNKPSMVALDLAMKQKQIDQIQADIDFNVSKKLIMESTRKDNVRMQAAREFAELLKYISAAGAVPAETDFTNIRSLITGIIDGVTTPDNKPTISNPVSGNSWVKVV